MSNLATDLYLEDNRQTILPNWFIKGADRATTDDVKEVVTPNYLVQREDVTKYARIHTQNFDRDYSVIPSTSTEWTFLSTSKQQLPTLLEDVELDLSTIRPKQKRAREAFQTLQEWEGVVISIDESSSLFEARLYDKTDDSNPAEEADFSFDEISSDDLKLLTKGALFNWVIGYDLSKGGKRRMSQIVFRRLPQWTSNDIKNADKKVNEMFGNIEWE